MALSKIEIDKIDHVIKKKIIDINANISNSEKYLNDLLDKLNTFKQITTFQIDQHTNLMNNFIFHNGKLPNINLKKLNNKFINLNNLININQKNIDALKISHTELISDVRNRIIESLYASTLLKSMQCPICFDVAPPVSLKFPCHKSIKKISRPACWKSVCMTCACHITKLNNNNTSPSIVKCPWCLTAYYPLNNAYELNMPWIASVDKCIEDENLVFREFSGIPLNPISCPNSGCNKSFNGISDLHHHMLGNFGFIICQM